MKIKQEVVFKYAHVYRFSPQRGFYPFQRREKTFLLTYILVL